MSMNGSIGWGPTAFSAFYGSKTVGCGASVPCANRDQSPTPVQVRNPQRSTKSPTRLQSLASLHVRRGARALVNWRGNTIKIDLISPASFAQGHPFEQYRWLRENAPVYWHEEAGAQTSPETQGAGFWVLSRYQDVFKVGHDPRRFSSEPTIMIDNPPSDAAVLGDPENPRQMMLMMDPPQHTQYRKLISREFMPGPATALVPRLQELARQIVDSVIDRGQCDFVADIAGEMPSFVIAELMGLPLADGRRLYELTEIIHTSPEALPEGANDQAVIQMFGYAAQVFDEKSKQPTDDLASQLIHAEIDGQKLDLLDFQLFFMLLVDAGGDTTRNLLSAGMVALLEHPEQLAALRADPTLVPNARDELLRWVSPVIYMRRTATEDVRLHGQQIRAGDKVVMYYGSANRDNDAFDAPDKFDIYRPAAKHLAFGHGTHVCLGQHIARAEIDAMLTEVLVRMDNLQLAEPPVWLPSNFISGPQSMPVSFTSSE